MESGKCSKGLIRVSIREVLLVNLLIFFMSSFAFSNEPNTLTADISVKKEPIREVINILQKQTGYRLKLISIDESLKVTGEYKGVLVEKIITSILNEYNIAVTIDPKNRIIFVTSLGEKIKGAKTATQSLGDTASLSVFADPEAVTIEAPLQHQSSQSLEDIPSQEVGNFPQQQNIDPLTKLPLEELEAMHAEQIREFKKNPKAFDPLVSSAEGINQD